MRFNISVPCNHRFSIIYSLSSNDQVAVFSWQKTPTPSYVNTQRNQTLTSGIN